MFLIHWMSNIYIIIIIDCIHSVTWSLKTILKETQIEKTNTWRDGKSNIIARHENNALLEGEVSSGISYTFVYSEIKQIN